MSGSTRFASWDANTHGWSSGNTCLPRELRTALDKRRVPTVNLDSTDAYHQAPDLDDVVVEPPEEYLNRLRAAGMSTDIWWKLQKQLPVDAQLVNVGSIISRLRTWTSWVSRGV